MTEPNNYEEVATKRFSGTYKYGLVEESQLWFESELPAQARIYEKVRGECDWPEFTQTDGDGWAITAHILVDKESERKTPLPETVTVKPFEIQVSDLFERLHAPWVDSAARRKILAAIPVPKSDGKLPDNVLTDQKVLTEFISRHYGQDSNSVTKFLRDLQPKHPLAYHPLKDYEPHDAKSTVFSRWKEPATGRWVSCLHKAFGGRDEADAVARAKAWLKHTSEAKSLEYGEVTAETQWPRFSSSASAAVLWYEDSKRETPLTEIEGGSVEIVYNERPWRLA